MLIPMTDEPRTPEPDDTAPTEPLSSGDPLHGAETGGRDPKSDPPPPSSPGVRRLTRSSSDKLIGGVAGGLADAIELRGLELGGAEVLECLDDPTVRLCAFTVHIGIRSF